MEKRPPQRSLTWFCSSVFGNQHKKTSLSGGGGGCGGWILGEGRASTAGIVCVSAEGQQTFRLVETPLMLVQMVFW